jgi:riboflavin kinase/FMN adenylyltransferase
MQILRLSAGDNIPDAASAAVAIGNFDGMHQGHRAVIRAMLEAARAERLLPTVLTFEPHPRRYFDKHHAPFHLERVTDKLRHLQALGVARVVMFRFNATLASLSAESFVQEILLAGLAAKQVITGEHFAFGKGRAGDAALMTRLLMARGAAHQRVAAVMWQGQVCSSTAIRRALAAGDITTARGLLGHEYILSSRVQHGDKRGRQLGFPTANLHFPHDLLLPRYGVYAVRAEAEGVIYDGVANLGIRPMYESRAPLLEVHLLDAAPMLYGQNMRVALHAYLREEMYFSTPEHLVAQMAKDCVAARTLLQAIP